MLAGFRYLSPRLFMLERSTGGLFPRDDQCKDDRAHRDASIRNVECPKPVRTNANVDEINHARGIPDPIQQISDGPSAGQREPSGGEPSAGGEASVEGCKDKENGAHDQNQRWASPASEKWPQIEAEGGARIVDQGQSNERVQKGEGAMPGAELVNDEILGRAICDDEYQQKRPEGTCFRGHGG